MECDSYHPQQFSELPRSLLCAFEQDVVQQFVEDVMDCFGRLPSGAKEMRGIVGLAIQGGPVVRVRQRQLEVNDAGSVCDFVCPSIGYHDMIASIALIAGAFAWTSMPMVQHPSR